MNTNTNSNFSILSIDLIKYLALFYLIILSNFLLNFLTCYQTNFILKNKLVLYLLGFFLFYFLVGLTKSSGITQYIPPIQKLITAFFYYILFLISIRLDIKIMLLVLFIIFVIFFLQTNKDYYLKMQNDKMSKFEREFYDNHYYWITLDYPIKIRLLKVDIKQFEYIDMLEKLFYYIIWILLLIGIIAYKGEITHHYKLKKITWVSLLIDTSICNFENRQSLLFYLKKGLNL